MQLDCWRLGQGFLFARGGLTSYIHFLSAEPWLALMWTFTIARGMTALAAGWNAGSPGISALAPLLISSIPHQCVKSTCLTET